MPAPRLGRVERALAVDPEDRRRRRLHDGPVRLDQQCLVGAVALGDPRGGHVRLIGERLQAGEHDRRLVLDAREREAVLERVRRLDDREPAPAPREHEPQLAVVLAVGLEQPRDLALECRAVPLEEDALGRAVEPVEVIRKGKRPPVVELEHLERAVAPDEAVVHDRDRRLADGHDRAVERAEQRGAVGGVGHEAI